MMMMKADISYRLSLAYLKINLTALYREGLWLFWGMPSQFSEKAYMHRRGSVNCCVGYPAGTSRDFF